MKFMRLTLGPAAASGSIRDEQSKKQSVNRGVAVLGDRVFFVTSDCHLVALNRITGPCCGPQNMQTPISSILRLSLRSR